jgi:hypothetical protein
VGRLPGISCHEAHPGIVNTNTTQLDIIKQLEMNFVRIVVREKTPKNEALLILNHSAPSPLDSFVQDKFYPIGLFGHYEVLRRKTGIASP